MRKPERIIRRRSTNRIIGRHWCGGVLVKDGRSATRCLRCDRVRFLGSKER